MQILLVVCIMLLFASECSARGHTRRRCPKMRCPVVTPPACVSKAAPARSVLDQLQGRWRLVKIVDYRTPESTVEYAESTSGELSVSGASVVQKETIWDHDREFAYSIEIEEPQGVSFCRFSGKLESGELIAGIIEINGDTLRRAVAWPGEPSPTKFQVPRQRYTVWKREPDLK